jgi:RNA polymerase sigma factor (sigma-70 family)
VEATQLGGTTPSLVASAIDFDAAWPVARSRVVAVLRGRGVQAADVDDIVQEAAIRAFRQLERFTSEEHLVRWCCRVAINAHIDTLRRGRRIVAEPSEEAAGPLNVAETVEDRLALHAALAEVAGLSEEDRALLLHPPVADNRKEAVRLAVRRHRIRARLANMLEGVLAGVPVLRRLHADSFPVRAAMFAAPVVAVLTALPFIAGSGAGGSAHVDQRTERAAVKSVSLPGRGGATRDRAGATSDPHPAANPPAPASRTLVDLRPAGAPVFFRRDDQPSGTPLFCAKGLVNLCVDAPGPYVPLPAPPLPGDSAPPS